MTRTMSSSLVPNCLCCYLGVAVVLFFDSTFALDEPCTNGSCPASPVNGDSTDTEEDTTCSLWLGPSLIKEHEEHGFGLGMFTGNFIKAGEVVNADLLIPIYDWDDENHPPLREYLWNGNNIPNMSLQSKRGAYYFTPGLGSIVPCTSKNANLENTHAIIYEGGNRDSPTAGSFSRHSSHFFQAARDISPGEELTVECSDSDFDGGTYSLQRYHHSTDTEEIICLDDNFTIRSSSSDTSIISGGRGVFAKQGMKKDQVVFSTPVVPISRKELRIPQDIVNEYDTPQHQLLLNYCFGHPNSDLLLLPYGPIAGYINHKSYEPNVKIQWHTSKYTSRALTKRQQHHHPELLELSQEVVSNVHGKGLMLDYVALRDIEPGEEIYLDYGDSWMKKWQEHSKKWSEQQNGNRHDLSALEYTQKYDMTILRTPKEQWDHPYPSNLMFACQHSSTWVDPEMGVLYQEHNYLEDPDVDCLTPCIIEARYTKNVFNEETNQEEELILYTTKLIEVSGNKDIDYECLLVADVEYNYVDVPREAILVIDRPYSEDVFHSQAFRHEIQVPSDLYPDAWLDKKIRRRQISTYNEHTNESFKRKEATKPQSFKKAFKGS